MKHLAWWVSLSALAACSSAPLPGDAAKTNKSTMQPLACGGYASPCGGALEGLWLLEANCSTTKGACEVTWVEESIPTETYDFTGGVVTHELHGTWRVVQTLVKDCDSQTEWTCADARDNEWSCADDETSCVCEIESTDSISSQGTYDLTGNDVRLVYETSPDVGDGNGSSGYFVDLRYCVAGEQLFLIYDDGSYRALRRQ